MAGAKMMRCRNWDVKLAEWANQRLGLPFEWGRTDCVSLVREALGIMYPDEFYVELPIWSDKEEAKVAMKQVGGIRGKLLSLGAKEHPILFAQSGDILVFRPDEEDEGCGIVIGANYISVIPGAEVFLRSIQYDLRAITCMRWVDG